MTMATSAELASGHQFADLIDISILNKLEAEHRKKWEGWEED
jgi:hypothetical protein